MAAIKRTRLSIEQKVEVIDFVNSGNSQTAAAKKFGLSRPAVNSIMQNVSKLQDAYENEIKYVKRKNVGYDGKSTVLDHILHDWHVRIENDARNLNITGEIIQTKALHFRDLILAKHSEALKSEVKLSLQSFKASKGWLEKFMQRTRGKSKTICGESKSVDMNAVEQKLAKIRKLLTDVRLDCIWNVDEMALQHRTTSARSYVTVNHDGRGTKRCKDRITVTPVVNAAGGTLPLQVIGKSKNPRVLKGVNIDATFNIQYESQKCAWQDGSTMIRLFHRIDRAARLQQKTFYILLDNCSSHLYAARMLDPNGSVDDGFKYNNLVIAFLPPGSTSECQPLDQGIIRSLKAGYRRAMLRTLLDQYDAWQLQRVPKSTDLFPVHSHTHMRNVLNWLKGAYNELSENVIQRCFVKSNVLPALSNLEANTNISRVSSASSDRDKQVEELSNILMNVQLEDDLASCLGLKGDMKTVCDELIHFDKAEPTESTEVNEEDIIIEILTATDSVSTPIDATPVDVDSDDEDVAEIISPKAALEMITDIRLYFDFDSLPNHVDNENLQTLLKKAQKYLHEKIQTEHFKKLTQPKIAQFFSSNIEEKLPVGEK